MRIGIVTGEYPPMQGGVGAYSQVLAQTFARQGHAVLVFSSPTAGHHPPEIPLTDTVDGWGFASLRAVKRWARDNRLDVVNVQFQTAAFHMSPWMHFLPHFVRDVPVVTTFHDLRFPYLFPKAGPLRDWIVMHLARASSGVIVTNHEDFARVRHLSHAALIPIGSNILAPLPAEYERDDWRTRAGAARGDFLLAHFGFVNRSKGLETLLHSLAELHAQNAPVRLLMIGGRTGTSDPTNAAYADEIDALIARLDLAPCIHWTGFVDDKAVSAYLAASDAVALPYQDGASFRRGSLMAAIHHGCAIIATQPQVAIPTFIDGETMLLIPPGDSAALSGAVLRLRDSPDLRDHLRQGAKRLSAQFDWSQIARDCVSFFERVCGDVRAASHTEQEHTT